MHLFSVHMHTKINGIELSLFGEYHGFIQFYPMSFEKRRKYLSVHVYIYLHIIYIYIYLHIIYIYTCMYIHIYTPWACIV